MILNDKICKFNDIIYKKGSENFMSEIWNTNSTIEEKHSEIRTPQLSQLKNKFNIRNIYDIIKKYQNSGNIEENDYINLCWFIASEYAEQFNELSNYVKELFGDKLKDEYFKFELNNNKDKLQSHAYDLVYKYFFENELNTDNINLFKNELYKCMVKIPRLFNSDMISKDFKEKINKILPLKEVKKRDIESTMLNSQETETSNTLYQKKLTNDKLKYEILKNMPFDYSDLEKSIYIYIKLCQFLSYDPNYYANKNLYRDIHKEFENVSKIGKETNNTICYEFVTIYSEMLKDMGIDVSVTTKLDMDVDEEDKIVFTNFDDSHANLKYVVDNMVISADSTLSVLNGDLINAKMNNQLNGLQCLSVDKDTREKFNAALNKVYSNLHLENSSFKKYDDDVKNKTLVEKLRILFNDISNTNFNSTDFISYITSIKHELFTDDELDWNLKISYIGKNNDEMQYPVALFSVNTNDIKNVQKDTVQYLYDSYEKKVSKVEKEELEEMFVNGKLFFIDGIMNIPNINLLQNNNLKK